MTPIIHQSLASVARQCKVKRYSTFQLETVPSLYYDADLCLNDNVSNPSHRFSKVNQHKAWYNGEGTMHNGHDSTCASQYGNLHVESFDFHIPNTIYQRQSVDVVKEQLHCQQHLSISLHLHREEFQDGLVAWLENNIDGPYAGKHEKLLNTNSLKLDDDSCQSFFFFYTKLRALLTSTGFHAQLLPPIEDMHSHIDLTQSPMIAEMMPPLGRDSTPCTQSFLNTSHHFLGQILHSVLLCSIDIKKCKIGRLALQRSLKNQDGFQVLMDIFKFFHPQLVASVAPTFESIKDLIPSFHASGDLHTYKADFDFWLERLSLYPEYIHVCASDESIWYIEGLSTADHTLLQSDMKALLQHCNFFSH